jgi:hypothetical protein
MNILNEAIISISQRQVVHINDGDKRRANYSKNVNKVKSNPPIFQNKNKHLLYLSVQKLNVKRQVNFVSNTVEKVFKDFKPDFMLFESVTDLNSWKTEINACLPLAVEYKIPFSSINLTEGETVEFLENKGYSKDEIYFAFCIQVLDKFFKKNQDEYILEEQSFAVFIENYLKGFEQKWSWEGYNFSFENFTRLYEKFTDFEFDINDRRAYTNYTGHELFEQYTDWQRFNMLNADIIYFQDIIAVKKIYLALQKYDKVLVVTTGFHYILQKPALEKMFELLPN